jgi:hypothetical protein
MQYVSISSELANRGTRSYRIHLEGPTALIGKLIAVSGSTRLGEIPGTLIGSAFSRAAGGTAYKHLGQASAIDA